jgi:hypothetical protein
VITPDNHSLDVAFMELWGYKEGLKYTCGNLSTGQSHMFQLQYGKQSLLRTGGGITALGTN